VFCAESHRHFAVRCNRLSHRGRGRRRWNGLRCRGRRPTRSSGRCGAVPSDVAFLVDIRMAPSPDPRPRVPLVKPDVMAFEAATKSAGGAVVVRVKKPVRSIGSRSGCRPADAVPCLTIGRPVEPVAFEQCTVRRGCRCRRTGAPRPTAVCRAVQKSSGQVASSSPYAPRGRPGSGYAWLVGAGM